MPLYFLNPVDEQEAKIFRSHAQIYLEYGGDSSHEYVRRVQGNLNCSPQLDGTYVGMFRNTSSQSVELFLSLESTPTHMQRTVLRGRGFAVGDEIKFE